MLKIYAYLNIPRIVNLLEFLQTHLYYLSRAVVKFLIGAATIPLSVFWLWYLLWKFLFQ